MRILITGVAGFIGFHVAIALLARGDVVIGVDSMNAYYDPILKQARLAQLNSKNWLFYMQDITDFPGLQRIFESETPDYVIHLAAQAGVRYSVSHPMPYIQANLLGFGNILELCRLYKVKHLVYGSSSSVYGANTVKPFSEDQATNHPLTVYAATKKSNELMAHAYSNIYHLPTTGLRFFTVYGPWGRPDMAFFMFTERILKDLPITVYNEGQMVRDFTYIDDIVTGILNSIDNIAAPEANWDSNNPDPASSLAPYKVYNLGKGAPVLLMDYINALEQAIGKKAIIEYQSMQAGDVLATHADINRAEFALTYQPKVGIREGIEKFVSWYRAFYQM